MGVDRRVGKVEEGAAGDGGPQGEQPGKGQGQQADTDGRNKTTSSSIASPTSPLQTFRITSRAPGYGLRKKLGSPKTLLDTISSG